MTENEDGTQKCVIRQINGRLHYVLKTQLLNDINCTCQALRLLAWDKTIINRSNKKVLTC